MRFFLLLIIFCSCLSCKENTARYPLNKKKQVFLNSSAERNKMLLAREEVLLKKAAKKDTALDFQPSELGFLFAYIKKASTSIPLPQQGTKVAFQYQI